MERETRNMFALSLEEICSRKNTESVETIRERKTPDTTEPVRSENV